MKELDILILGPVPPPWGGIAVHIDRLVPLLEETGFRVGVLNHFAAVEKPFVLGALNRNPVNYYRLPRRIAARILHYHHSHWAAFLAVALGRDRGRCRYIITLHSPALATALNSRVPLVGRVIHWGLSRFDVVIVVSPHIARIIETRSVRRPIHVLPAFLEAPKEERPYNSTVEAFLSTGPTLVVPVYRVAFLRDGRDVYGLDTVAEAFVMLAAGRPRLKLAFFIANRPKGRRARAYLAGLEGRLEKAGYRDRSLIAFGLSLVPAFRHDVIVVRATRIEGDALSVREAIGANIPVVASDIVNRPPGATTFRADNVNDLRRAIDVLLDKQRSAHERVGEQMDRPSAHQTLEQLVGIYFSQLDAVLRNQQ